MENKRSSWGSNLGFLLAAVGSAVGLGNIWGFPYKMGRSGGFTFLLIYLLLAVFVGLVIMASELALGRKTGLGVVGAYQAVSKRFGWVGWLGVLSPFLIMSFYAVLGGYCIQYMSLNMAELSFNLSDIFGAPLAGGATFGAMLDNPFGCADASNYEKAWNYKRFDPSGPSKSQTRQKEVAEHSATDGSKGRYAIPFR